MIIAASIIKKARKQRRCEFCNRFIEGPTLRMYGYGVFGDPPYAIYVHPGCTDYNDPKIIKAIQNHDPDCEQFKKGTLND